jgi:trans-aconitate 2-methyltransferase
VADDGGVADWDGLSYRKVSALQMWLATQSLAGVSMAGDERVLDVGCGDGRITAAIADQLPDGSILGIDPSPRMITAARSLESPRLRFVPGDVLTMDFRDEFDAVVSFNALHWVPDQHAALTRVRAALRDRAWALVQVVCAGKRPSLEAVAMRTCGQPVWREHFTDFRAPFVHVDPARYAELAAGAGLALTDREVSDRSWDFDSGEEFARWCRVGFDSWTARLPDDAAAEAFVADVLGTYERITGSPRRLQFMQLRARLTPAR